MISNLETKSSKKLSKELSSIFNNAIQEIQVLVNKAPDQIIDSVHLIRKRLKFLRAFVKLTRFCTDDENYKPVNYILRDSGRILSDCRDAHVRKVLLVEYMQYESLNELIEELIELNNRITKKFEKDLLQETAAFEELTSDITRKEVKDYVNSIEPNAECLTSGLTLGYEKSYRAFHSELKSHKADLLHEWRKRTKDLQYQVEALLGSIPDLLSTSYEKITVLCEMLGRINDLFMFVEWLNSVQDSIETKNHISDLKKIVGRELSELENQADKMGHTLFTLSPKQFSQKLREEINL